MAARRWYPGKYFLVIFHHFLIVLHLRSPPSGRARIIIISSCFFIFPSFLGRWGLEAEARLFILSSFFLHLRWRSGPKGRGPGGGRWGGGGGGGQNAEPFHFAFFSLFFIFSSFSSFFLHFPLRFFFVCSFICVIIFSSFLRCRSPKSSFFLHFVFIFPGGLPHNLHFCFISLPAVLDTGAARGRGTKMQNDEKMMKK